MNTLVTKLSNSQGLYLTGDVIDDWLNNIIRWGLEKALTIGGGILVFVGLADIVAGLSGNRKNYKRAAIGVLITIFGGFLFMVGAASWIKKAQTLGDAVPK